uniref:hypothetical protein n=1 Tax=Bradyrhizobium sp. USDA 3458 TaxID=2591461 RepID=UPI00132F943C
RNRSRWESRFCEKQHALAAAAVRARRLRESGKNDSEERKTILQAIRATGLRPSPAQATTAMSLADQLVARGYAAPDDDDEETIAEASE